jgi:hypothetical protein
MPEILRIPDREARLEEAKTRFPAVVQGQILRLDGS